MSPSSSPAALPSHIRTRGFSNATPVQDPSILQSPRRSSRPSSPSSIQPTSPLKTKANYIVFIRLPFPRGDFRDPPPVDWTVTKDRQLWKLISKANDGDLDWGRMSQEFGVELEFLLMQAAWLSERHMERMRRQVTRIGTGGGEAAESKPLPGSVSVTTGPLLRRGSSSLEAQIPSSPNPDAPAPRPPGLPTISRTPSSATVTQSKLAGVGQYQPQGAPRGSSGSTHRPIVTSPSKVSQEYYEDAIEHEEQSDSASDEEPISALARSQMTFRRPAPKLKSPALNTLASDADEDDDADEGDDDDSSNGGGYLPFAAASRTSDPAATIRGKSAQQQSSRPPTATTRAPRAPVRTATESSQSSTTSSTAPPGSAESRPMARHLSSQPTSSASQALPRRRASHSSAQQSAHPLSPCHRAQLASLSPRSHREGSDGTPSMGSSFSDLDAESLNSSALEDALMSNMQRGGGSTFSALGGLSMAERVGRMGDKLVRRGG